MLGPDGAAILRETERMIMLSRIDQQWKDHTTPGYPANEPKPH